jgi:hypothetical protein
MIKTFGNMENFVNTHTHTHSRAKTLTGARAEYNTNKLNKQESLTNFSNRGLESFETVSEKNNTSFGDFLLRTATKGRKILRPYNPNRQQTPNFSNF